MVGGSIVNALRHEAHYAQLNLWTQYFVQQILRMTLHKVQKYCISFTCLELAISTQHVTVLAFL